MTARSLDYLPAARAEFVRAAEAVEALTGLGLSFDAETRRVEAAILEAPEAQPLELDAPPGLVVRRARIGRFPWRLVYLVEPARLLVVAVAHVGREPGYWGERLDQD